MISEQHLTQSRESKTGRKKIPKSGHLVCCWLYHNTSSSSIIHNGKDASRGEQVGSHSVEEIKSYHSDRDVECKVLNVESKSLLVYEGVSVLQCIYIYIYIYS